MKELERVWSQYQTYSAYNTLMIEDKPYRAIHNPVGRYQFSNSAYNVGLDVQYSNFNDFHNLEFQPNTSIFVNSYDLENETDNFLDPNGELCTYLNGVAEADDVQDYVKENHFGLPGISGNHRDWELYMLLTYSTFGNLVKLRDLLELEEEEEEDESSQDAGSQDAIELNLPFEDMHIEVPLPKRKKLLIMNLNGFLMRRINFADWENNPSTRIADYIYRNFLRKLLKLNTLFHLHLFINSIFYFF